MKTLRIVIFAFVVGWIGTANGQTIQVRNIETVAALMSRPAAPGEIVQVANGSTNSPPWDAPRVFRWYDTGTITNAHDGVHFITNSRSGSIYVSFDRLSKRQSLSWWNVSTNTDASAALQAANNYVASIGGGTIEIPVSIKLTSAVAMSDGVFIELSSSGTTIDASGYTTAGKPAIYWQGSVGTPSGLLSNVLASTNKIHATGMSLSAGDYVLLSDTNNFSGSPFRSYYFAGEFAQVSSYDGTNITTAGRVRGPYSSATTKVWPATLITGGISGGTYIVAPDAIGPAAWYTKNWTAQNIRLSGSRYAHLSVSSSLFPRIIGVQINDNTEPNVGQNYGVAFGCVQGAVVQGCEIATKRHAVAFGSAWTLPSGSSAIPLMNSDNLVTGNIRIQALEAHAVDSHGNSVFLGVVNNVIDGGVVVGGDNNFIGGNTRISNSPNEPAIALVEPLGANLTIVANTIKLSKIAGFTWGISANFPNASGYGSDTNDWTGTVATGDSSFVVRNNRFILDGAELCDGCLLGYFGESASNPTNNTPWTVATVDISNNTADIDTVPAGTRAYAFQVLPVGGMRIAQLRYSGNDFGQLGLYAANSGGTIEIHGNTLRNATGGSGSYAPIQIVDTALKLPGYLDIDGLTVDGTMANVRPIIVDGMTGNVRLAGSRFTDWQGTYGVQISSSTLTNIDLLSNTYESRSNALTALSVSASAATLTDRWNRFRGVGSGSVTEGTVTVGSTIKFRDEPTITSLNRRFSATSTPSWTVEGALTADNGRVTNTFAAQDMVAKTLSFRNGSVVPFTTWPLVAYAYATDNDTVRVNMQNAGTGTAAHAGYAMDATGSAGQLISVNTNNASGNLRSRILLQSSLGSGITYDILASGDNVWTYGGGVEMARMSTNEFLLTLPNMRLAPGKGITLGGVFRDTWPSGSGTNGTFVSVNGGTSLTTADFDSSATIGFTNNAGDVNAFVVDGSLGTNHLSSGALSYLRAWSTLTGTPTTLVGYGISDAQPLDADLTAVANGTAVPTAQTNLISWSAPTLYAGTTNVAQALAGKQSSAAILTDLSNIIPSLGALAYYNGANWVRFLPGPSGYVIGSDGSTISWTPNGSGGSGTVTSVGLAVPSGFTVSGSPVTTNGTITIGGVLDETAGGTGITNTTPYAQTLLRSADEVDALTALTLIGGTPTDIDSVARTTVRKDGGVNVGSRRRLNFIQGTNTVLTVADDAANEEVDITIASAATGSGGGDLVPVAVTIATTAGTTTIASGTTNETSLLGSLTANSSTNFAANALASGALLRMKAHGNYTASGADQTGWLRFKVGSYVAEVQLDEPESYVPTNSAWTAEANILVETAGSSATVKSWGTLIYEQLPTATYAGGATTRFWTNSGTLDTTTSVNLAATWQNSGASPVTFVCHGIVIERLGQNVTVGGGTGTKTLFRWAAEQGFQPASNPATFAARNTLGVMEFDPSTQEAIRFRSVVPEATTATTVSVILKWTTDATSGDGRWGARFWALTGDIDSDSFATAVEGTTTTSGTAGTINTTTLSAVGLDSASAGDGIVLEIYRDVGDAADTINSNDIQLHTVEVRTE